MAISRKPTTEKQVKEKDINALINKGGSTAESDSKKINVSNLIMVGQSFLPTFQHL